MTEALRVLDVLKEAGMADCLKLLHFHLGSQITNIRHIKAAVNRGRAGLRRAARRAAAG